MSIQAAGRLPVLRGVPVAPGRAQERLFGLFLAAARRVGPTCRVCLLAELPTLGEDRFVRMASALC